MSSPSFAVVEDSSVPAVAAQPARAVRSWHQSRWCRVVFACCMLVVGASKICKGLVLLTGATNYGALLEVNHADLYYTTAVSREDAKALGDFLVKAKFFDGRHVSVQLTKEGQTTQIRFPVKPGFDKDETYIASIRTLGFQISQRVFHGAPVEIHLCDRDLKTQRAVPAAATAK